METIEELKEQNAALNARLVKAGEMFKTQKQEIVNKDQEIAALKEQIESLKTESNGDDDRTETHGSAISQMEKEIAALKEENESLKAEIMLSGDSAAEVENLKKRLTDAKDFFNKQKEMIAAKDTTIAEQIKEIESQAKAIEQLNAAIKKCADDNTELNNKLTASEQALENEKNAAAELKKKAVAMKSSVEANFEELSASTKKVKDILTSNFNIFE